MFFNGQVVEELDGSGRSKAQNVFGNGLVFRKDGNTGKSGYYLFNSHGDVTKLTDVQSGRVLNQYQYDIWGNPKKDGIFKEEMPNPFRYSGEMLDAKTGMYYLRARYYDPSVGRFISEDTYKGQVDNPLSLNRYTYVHNNPVNNIDPTGHWCESVGSDGGIDGKWSHSGGCNKEGSYWSPDGMHVWDDIKENGKVVGEYGYLDYLNDEVFTVGTALEVTPLVGTLRKAKTIQQATESIGLLLKMDLQFFSSNIKGWIKHDVYNEIRNRFGKDGITKFIDAMNKGIVGAIGQNGIKMLAGNGVKVGNTYYKYEVKVKGLYGDWRIYGNIDAKTGQIIFDYFGKGMH